MGVFCYSTHKSNTIREKTEYVQLALLLSMWHKRHHIQNGSTQVLSSFEGKIRELMYAVFVLRWTASPFCLNEPSLSPERIYKIGTIMSRFWQLSSWGQDLCPTKPENGTRLAYSSGRHSTCSNIWTHHGRYVLITSLIGLLHIGQHALICLFSFRPQSLHRHMCPQV